VAPGQTLEPDAQLLGVKNGWVQLNKLAIANREHAPCGRAARQALQALLQSLSISTCSYRVHGLCWRNMAF
jgi:hypothetical protein